jgi:hypothetical protein
MTQPLFNLHGHITIVTGPNQRTGAATACTLAPCGTGVFVSEVGIANPGLEIPRKV